MVFNTEQPEPALWKTLTEGVEPLVDNMEVQTLLDALETIRDNSQTRTMSYSRNTLANGTRCLNVVKAAFVDKSVMQEHSIMSIG